jgi:hypothetical protein
MSTNWYRRVPQQLGVKGPVEEVDEGGFGECVAKPG